MKSKTWLIEISNPSDTTRSDYLQVDLNQLGVPTSLKEKDLTLYELIDQTPVNKIPFQIDHIFGKDNPNRILSFFSNNTPAGPDDYSKSCKSYLLVHEQAVKDFTIPGLKLKHHYENPSNDCDENGFDDAFVRDKPAHGVLLSNGDIEVYFKLKSSPRSPEGLSYSGSATKIFLPYLHSLMGTGEILSPFNPTNAEKLWGQLESLVFFPMPWEHKWFIIKEIRNLDYKIINSQCGPTRAIITLRLCEPLSIKYNAYKFEPSISPAKKLELKVYLYRVIYLYPGGGRPYYVEELYVMTEDNKDYISFRPYYFSKVPPARVPMDLNRIEHIPDYFALWKQFGVTGHNYWGYGFASDVHVRRVHMDNDKLYWRLPLSRNCRSVHYFMFEPTGNFNRLHTVGHSAWYERVFKPLEPVNVSLRFPPHLSYY